MKLCSFLSLVNQHVPSLSADNRGAACLLRGSVDEQHLHFHSGAEGGGGMGRKKHSSFGSSSLFPVSSSLSLPPPPQMPIFPPLSPHYGGVWRPSLVFDTDSSPSSPWTAGEKQRKGMIGTKLHRKVFKNGGCHIWKLCCGLEVSFSWTGINTDNKKEQTFLSMNIVLLIIQLNASDVQDSDILWNTIKPFSP